MSEQNTSENPVPEAHTTPATEQLPEWVLATSFRMMPSETNPDGNIYGAGPPCDHVDTAACMAALSVHSGSVATKHMELDFLAPIKVGDILKGFYKIDKIGNSSITIKVKLDAYRRQPASDLGSEEVVIPVVTATVIYVALDSDGKKTNVDRKGTKRD